MKKINDEDLYPIQNETPPTLPSPARGEGTSKRGNYFEMSITAQFLTQGGDNRLSLNSDTGANKYGCTPLPQTGLTSFSSSTARTISERVLPAIERECMELDQNNSYEFKASKMALLRAALENVLGLQGMGTEIILSASGTDATLQAVCLVSTLNHPNALNRKLDSILIAPDESGKGVPEAAAGRHPDTQTARGVTVEKGKPLGSWANAIQLISVSVRKSSGEARTQTDIDTEVLEIVEGSIKAGKGVLLHVMDSSKLGFHYPSPQCQEALKLIYGDAVHILADCCQGRLSLNRLQWHLTQGHWVTLTGSKFFTGPPFSGALLVPKQLASKIKAIHSIQNEVPPTLTLSLQKISDFSGTPHPRKGGGDLSPSKEEDQFELNLSILSGLSAYTESSSWPKSWITIRQALPDTFNAGLYIRWYAAVLEMRAYFSIPETFRNNGLQGFAEAIEQCIQSHDCIERLLPAPSRFSVDNIHDAEMAIPTIFPFFVRHRNHILSFDACTVLCSLLSRDISKLLPETATKEQQLLAAQRFQLGQPVRVASGYLLPIPSIKDESKSPPPLRGSGVLEKSEIFWGDRARVGGEYPLLNPVENNHSASENTAVIRLCTDARMVYSQWLIATQQFNKLETVQPKLDMEIALIGAALDKIALILLYADSIGFDYTL